MSAKFNGTSVRFDLDKLLLLKEIARRKRTSVSHLLREAADRIIEEDRQDRQ
jgi:hypothetical protein